MRNIPALMAPVAYNGSVLIGGCFGASVLIGGCSGAEKLKGSDVFSGLASWSVALTWLKKSHAG